MAKVHSLWWSSLSPQEREGMRILIHEKETGCRQGDCGSELWHPPVRKGLSAVNRA